MTLKLNQEINRLNREQSNHLPEIKKLEQILPAQYSRLDQRKHMA